MKTSTRKPKIYKKPTKGMKMFLKQNRVTHMIQNVFDKNHTQWWRTPRAQRGLWLLRFNRSRYKPHQGYQEKARRMRQMTHGKCIDPGSWYYSDWKQPY